MIRKKDLTAIEKDLLANEKSDENS
jgi:hypothetical protein